MTHIDGETEKSLGIFLRTVAIEDGLTSVSIYI